MQQILDDTFLTFQILEHGNFDYGTSTMSIFAPCFGQLKITLNKVLLTSIDDTHPSYFNIGTCACAKFSGNEDKVIRILNKKFGMDFADKTWEKTSKKIIYLKYEIYVASNYSEADYSITENLLDALTDYIYYFYKSVSGYD